MRSLTRILFGIVSSGLLAAALAAQPKIGAGNAVAPPGLWEPWEVAIPTEASANLRETGASPHNPWLDYRMHAWLLSPSGRVLSVPGFYAGDGAGGARGNVWKLRHTFDEPGIWWVGLMFEHGHHINVADLTVRGTPLYPHGHVFQAYVGGLRSEAQGFHRHGPIEAVGARYLRHRDGKWFLKTGTNSPENFLAYRGFDGARDLGGLPRGTTFLHHYQAHRKDWRSGDPNWSSGGDPDAGKNIIGVLNYLASVGVNSIYFLPLNLGGDGQDVFPFLDPTGSEFHKVVHYAVRRMEQWNVVFEHAQRRGIMLEFVLAERESENVRWLGEGLTVQRKLFLKQLIAMFGHHAGIRWILCEENAPEPTDVFTVEQLTSFANWIRKWDTIHHPIAVHTDPDDQKIYEQILAGGSASAWLTSTSLQVHSNYNPATEAAHDLFARHARAIDVHIDEQGTPMRGLDANNHDDMRKLVLWDVLLSAGNIAWYCGYHDLPVGGDIRLENFRTRESMWLASRHARELLESLPFSRMEPRDDLVVHETVSSRYGDAEVFADVGHAYVVYYADASHTGRIDLRAAPASRVFEGRWFAPKTGTWAGARFTRNGGQIATLPGAPHPSQGDWVLVLRRK